MTRTVTLRIRRAHVAVAREIRQRFVKACKTGQYQGEYCDFESPAALFRVLTPKRWALLETLQARGAMGVRALARVIERDVRRVHDDVRMLLEVGLIEKDRDGKLTVPFEEIHADLVLRKDEPAEVGSK
jgi:predicted transcriptional regulator